MNAVGFNPGQGILGGLRQKGPTAQLGKGLAMQNAAGANMEREKQNQQLGVQQMQADSQDRLAQARNQAEQDSNAARERTQRSGLESRYGASQIGLGYDYAGLQKRNSLRWQQALLGNLTGDM
jgi:hypothetical protein